MEHVPEPISPNRNTTDASAVSFNWTLIADAQDYELAVGTSAEFDGGIVRLFSGGTNVLTLYEALPEDGRTFYWKVRAKLDQKWTAWSDVIPFVAGSADEPIPAEQPATTRQDGRIAQTTSVLPARAAVEQIGVSVDGTTSFERAFAFFSIMVGSFVALVLILMSV